MFLGKGFSRVDIVQGLIVKPSPPVRKTTTKPVRQTNLDTSARNTRSRTTATGNRHQTSNSRNSDVTTGSSIRRTDESSSQGTTNIAVSNRSTVGRERPTTTRARATTNATTAMKNSSVAEYKNPATCPPPIEQVQIHHDSDSNHDRDHYHDHDHDNQDDKQEASAASLQRREKLKSILKERKRALLDERRRVKEKIRSIDQALQNLRRAGGGKGDDSATQGSRTSTVITAESTPLSSPVTNVETKVRTANSVKKDNETKTQDVRNIEWTVAAPHRRCGLYSGTALKGKIPHGTGVLVFEDEEVYEGPFKYGVMQGSKGLLMSASGGMYEGAFWLNLRHGHGEEVFACRSRHVGKYEKGLPHGFGERRNPDGSVFFVGQWFLGKPVGLHDVMEEGSIDEGEESDSNTAVISNVNNNALVSQKATSNRLLDVENDDCSLASSTDSRDGERVSMYETTTRNRLREVQKDDNSSVSSADSSHGERVSMYATTTRNRLREVQKDDNSSVSSAESSDGERVSMYAR